MWITRAGAKYCEPFNISVALDLLNKQRLLTLFCVTSVLFRRICLLVYKYEYLDKYLRYSFKIYTLIFILLYTQAVILIFCLSMYYYLIFIEYAYNCFSLLIGHHIYPIGV